MYDSHKNAPVPWAVARRSHRRWDALFDCDDSKCCDCCCCECCSCVEVCCMHCCRLRCCCCCYCCWACHIVWQQSGSCYCCECCCDCHCDCAWSCRRCWCPVCDSYPALGYSNSSPCCSGIYMLISLNNSRCFLLQNLLRFLHNFSLISLLLQFHF